ncbi:MAG: cbb3-type cytochrome c oxidase subunit I, partial [Chloroflexi bacterium]|nr:cbb3-type cytochrome c oxidase subunit I [Chloroflexota bacterium]
HMYLAFGLLAIGGLFGLFQALQRAGVDMYPSLPVVQSYYQGLTLHGVALALEFTFAFSNGFLALAMMRGFRRPMASTLLLWLAFGLGLGGALLAMGTIAANQASVLFTFYPPLQANPIFYCGLVLTVVSTWAVFANQILTVRQWRRESPGRRMPLMAFASLLTYVMWFIASLGVAVEVLVFVLPWSLGVLPGTDPELDRTLFWFTGHPIVYAWLLPAYVSWYTMIPRQVGGRVFSDSLARLVFLVFLLLSIPIGVHHQFEDAGISEEQKAIQAVLTFAFFTPSVVTAFSVMAGLENAGRARGGRGLLGWITRLPWGDPSVAAQLLSMLVFLLGGATGLINASYDVNLVVHNTAFIPGHFHLTVGTAVALSIIGISYWLIPYLTGNALWGRPLALAQAWTWAIGVLIFSRGQIAAGLADLPRRTAVATSAYVPLVPSWAFDNLLTAIGGVVMTISGVLFLLVMVATIGGAAGRAVVEIPIAAEEDLSESRTSIPVLDRVGPWVVATLLLIVVSYGPVFASLLPPNLTSPGFKVW